MTANELQDVMIAALVRGAGGSRRDWRMAIGPVRVYDIATHPHCNWSVAPSGSTQQVAQIERLLDRLRLEHPIVR